MNWPRLLLPAGLVLLALGAWWLLGSPLPRGADGGDGGLQPLDAQTVARGEAVYRANCAPCHGAKAEGAPNWRTRNPDGTLPPPPHDSSGHTWHHADGLLYRIVRDGGKIYESEGFKSAMPAWGDRLSPAEIRAVLAFLKSLWGPAERAAQAEVSRQDPFP